jgi:hypothetical protein
MNSHPQPPAAFWREVNGSLSGRIWRADLPAPTGSGPGVGYYQLYPGCGTVFALTPPSTSGGAWTGTVFHSFSGQNGDGAMPVAGLVLSSSGVLHRAVT